MKLLNKYQSRAFQFALELMSRLEQGRVLTSGEQNCLARERGLDYAGQVTEPLCEAELLKQEAGGLRLGENVRPPRLPMSRMEGEYLAYILDRPEADRFLRPETKEKLKASWGDPGFFAPIQQMEPEGESLPEYPGGEEFRILLEAIRRKCLIQYTFRSGGDDTLRRAEALPWKVEYSAYDRRWWVILYAPEEKRTIKARLSNLRDIRLSGAAHIPEEEITEALDRLLEPEPVVLEVQKTRGALERCFLTFEDQMFDETCRVSEARVRLVFRYYRFDRGEILRRLLYLGPAVELKGPADLRRELKDLLDQALA